MGTVAVKIKLMPTSPDENLDEIKEKAKTIIEENKGEGCKFEEEPIAFGLKAVIIFFRFPENEELEIIEEGLEKIENINSVQVLDVRRAFGG